MTTPVPVPVHRAGQVTAVGDSVMLDASPDLVRDITGIDVNASVSRQWQGGEEVIAQLKSAARLGAIAIVDLVTNGPIPAPDLDAMMSFLSDEYRWSSSRSKVHLCGTPAPPGPFT